MSQNHLNAIPTLPVDILCVIFELLRDIDLLSGSDSEECYFFRWIPETTHVCRSWRSAALSTRLLWTEINVTASIPWALEFARRSGTAPICLVVVQPLPGYLLGRGYYDIYECTKTLLLENRHRIRRMAFRAIDHWKNVIMKAPVDVRECAGATDGCAAFDWSLRDIITNALLDVKEATGSASFAILEDLEICLKHVSSNPTKFILTNDMLCAPELKKLSLEHCTVQVDFGSFHNLADLSVSACASCILSQNWLHSTLAQMPNLETLTLRQGPFPAPVSVDPEIQPIVLPKLLNIKIAAWAEWACAILQLISCGPSTRTLSVNSSVDQPAGWLEHILSLFTCVMSHATTTSNSIHQLNLSVARVPCPDEEVLLLHAWRGKWTSEPDIRLSILLPDQLDIPQSLPQGFAPVVYLMEGVVRRIHHQDLQVLLIDSPEILSTRLWVKLFGSLPSLSEIIISEGERELFAALIDGAEVAAPVPFQALKEISVMGQSSPSPPSYTEGDVKFMLTCLRKRLDLGFGLRRLGLRFGSRENVVSALKNVVELVEVENEL